MSSSKRRAAEGSPPQTSAIDNRRIGPMLRHVRHALIGSTPPVVSLIAEAERDPFKVLISTILSARTKDEVTAGASARLFAVASSPQEILALSEKRIEKLIFPVGFYKTKAKNLRRSCRALLDDFDGRVPDDIGLLIELPGVGRKTANLVLTEGFRKAAICVDTHVHRITNLWGYVDTTTPEQTEMALRDKLPKRHWLEINKLLVSFGQQICVPMSPKCSQCPVANRCPRIGVKRWR